MSANLAPSRRVTSDPDGGDVPVMSTKNIKGFEVPFTASAREWGNIWTKFEPNSRVVLPKGWKKAEGCRPLREAIVFTKDIPVQMRDGTIIRTDVFRPLARENERLPALVPWSPYGKSGTGYLFTNNYTNIAVPQSELSGLEKFEAPDPAEWCPRGYAIVSADARGCFNSDGDMHVFGTQEGQDGYDLIEWAAKQDWCNESVALVGNSWLGTAQWFIGAEKPPHLKAIAPWEGVGDFYRQTLCRGGIPASLFWARLTTGVQGKNNYEHVGKMLAQYPHMNEYWEDKNPKIANIDVPMYVTMSYSTNLHTEGSFRGWKYASSKDKWLRIHATQEWHDLYQPENTDDLQRFLDHYLLGKENGWEITPKVRVSLLRFGERHPISNRPEDNYPPSRTQYTTLYLDAESASLSPQKSIKATNTSYQADDWNTDGSFFTYTFDKYTEILGPSRAKLFMSTKDQDDMDVFVLIRKLDVDGKPMQSLNVPLKQQPPGTVVEEVPDICLYKHDGANGRLRASKRALGQDPSLSEAKLKEMVPTELWLPYDKEDKVPPGTIVELDIPLWPTGMAFDAGESMRLEVCGHNLRLHENADMGPLWQNWNKGRHTIHTGEDYPSQIMLPLVF